jgi:hypothetical protein
VRVETDDPVEPNITLTLSANVVVEVDFERPFLRIQNAKKGAESVQTVQILSKSPETLEFGEVNSEVKGLVPKLIKAEKDGKISWSLEIRFKPDAIGEFSGSVTVKVKKPKETVLTLNMSGRVEGDIWFNPISLTIFKDQGTPEKKAEGVVILKSDKNSFKILKAGDSSGKFAVTTKTIAKGKEYNVTVAVSEKQNKESNFSSKVVITTDSNEQPTIEIPVHYMASAPGPRESKSRIPAQITKPPININPTRVIKKIEPADKTEN